jgi:hypothetical protein
MDVDMPDDPLAGVSIFTRGRVKSELRPGLHETPPPYTDVLLVINGIRIWSHRVILHDASTYFELIFGTMIGANLKEHENGVPKFTLDLPPPLGSISTDPETRAKFMETVVGELVRFMYTGILESTPLTFVDTIQYMSFLQIRFPEVRGVWDLLTVYNVGIVWELCGTDKMSAMRSVCQQWGMLNIGEIRGTGMLGNISEGFLSMLILSDYTHVSNEFERFQIVCEHLRESRGSRSQPTKIRKTVEPQTGTDSDGASGSVSEEMHQLSGSEDRFTTATSGYALKLRESPGGGPPVSAAATTGSTSCSSSEGSEDDQLSRLLSSTKIIKFLRLFHLPPMMLRFIHDRGCFSRDWLLRVYSYRDMVHSGLPVSHKDYHAVRQRIDVSVGGRSEIPLYYCGGDILIRATLSCGAGATTTTTAVAVAADPWGAAPAPQARAQPGLRVEVLCDKVRTSYEVATSVHMLSPSFVGSRSVRSTVCTVATTDLEKVFGALEKIAGISFVVKLEISTKEDSVT